jgi:methionyl-tRNA formyltransferase
MKKIVLCGIQEQGKEIIRFLYDNNIKVTHIVTISKEVSINNKSNDTWVSYEDISKELNIPIYYAKSYSLKHSDDETYFNDNNFDILLLGGWQRLIPQQILDTIKICAIGQHGSPEFLPSGRGRSPLNWSLILGSKRLVWNIFKLEYGVDDGDIIDYQMFQINDSDTCNTLYYKVSVSVKHMLLRSIPKLLDGSLEQIKQIGKPTYFEKRTPSDGLINWGVPITDTYNLIRGITHPYPGAFTSSGKEKIMIWKSQIWDEFLDFYKDSEYGEVVEIFGNDFVVKCYGGLMLITEHDDVNLYKGKKYNTNKN